MITFVGASGGVGVSCLMAAVAVVAAQAGRRVGCMDRDAGGGLDVVFGMDHLPGVRWPQVASAHGEIAPEVLLRELPNYGGVWVVAHSREAVVEVSAEAHASVRDSLRAGTGLVLVDGGRARPAHAGRADPREVGASQHALDGGALDPAAWAGSDEVILVVGSTPQSLAAATAVVGALPEAGPRWWLAQRSPRGAGHLPATVQAALGMQLAAAVPDDPRLDQYLVAGESPGARGPLRKAATQLLQTVGGVRRVAA